MEKLRMNSPEFDRWHLLLDLVSFFRLLFFFFVLCIVRVWSDVKKTEILEDRSATSKTYTQIFTK